MALVEGTGVDESGGAPRMLVKSFDVTGLEGLSLTNKQALE